MAAKFIAGWRQVGACLILQAVGAAMIAPAFGVVAVALGQEFHPSRMVLMLAMTIMALVSAILSPFLGSLMDRTSLRRLMFLGAGFVIAGYLALSFSTSFTHVLLVYGLLMAPANVLVGTMAASVLISRWFVNRRGAALGIAISGVALGAFIFPPVVQWLIDSFEWRDGVRLLALIVFLFTFPAAALIVNYPSDKGLHPDGAQADPEITHASGPVITLSTRAVLADPTFWFTATVFAVVLSGMKGMITNLVPLAVDEGIRPDRAALLISISAACGFCAKLTFAAVSDKLNLRVLLFISLTGFGIGMACLVRADAGYWLIATGVCFVGLFGGLLTPMQALLVGRTYGRQVMGQVMGLMTLVVLCALLATPPLFGLIFDLTGDYDAIFVVFVALAAGTMLVVPHIRLHPKAATPESPDGGSGMGADTPILGELQKG